VKEEDHLIDQVHHQEAMQLQIVEVEVEAAPEILLPGAVHKLVVVDLLELLL
jgi:hypothetical protein